MNQQLRYAWVLTAAVTALAACGQREEGASTGSAEPAPVQSAQSSAPPSMPRQPAPANARLYFVTPADGDTVSSPVRVEFAVDGMEVVPAGTEAANSGHHHIIVDVDLPPMNLPIPADANHVHFGDGSSSAELTLEPGEHTLQLLFADHLHIPHDPPVVSERITITVE